ncbi:MAG: ABC transporter substrate-binding protein [Ruminiclostridium sp.]|nr:ABC transporter substrate-binding protein [Ruminiclostridium sp.]
MSGLKKRVSRIAALSAVTAALLVNSGGCADGGKGYVYYLNYNPEADSALHGIAEHYTELTGVPVKIITAASGSYPSTLSAQMNKPSPPTLFVCGDVRDIADWEYYCYDLGRTELSGMIGNTEQCLYDREGKMRAVGYCYEAFGIIVNKRLLAKAGYEVGDIRSFASLKAVAEDIHSRSGELGFDAFTSSGLDDSSSWRFSAHLANIPLYYEFRDDNITEQPASITGRYLGLYKNVWDMYINNATVPKDSIPDATGNMAEEEFGSGKAVFYQNGTWEYEKLTGSAGYSMDPGDLTMIPIYCGMEGEENAGLCVGTENYWAVNSQAGQKNIDATIDFMCWLVSSDEGRQMMSEQFGVTPFKGHTEPENVFFGAAKQYEDEKRYDITWEFGSTPNSTQWRAGVVSALTKYSCGGGDWSDVERAFAEGWSYQYRIENCIFD